MLYVLKRPTLSKILSVGNIYEINFNHSFNCYEIIIKEDGDKYRLMHIAESFLKYHFKELPDNKLMRTMYG